MKIGKLLTDPESTSLQSAEISLLRWVLWHPLLALSELVRLEQSRRGTPSGPAPQPTASQVGRQVHHLVKRGLLLAFRLHEPGWPPAQQRYALSAAGVAAFAHQFQPALSLQALTRAYPIEQEDLLSRLARPFPTLVLASCFTSLIEGERQGWQVRVFQFPCSWRHLLRRSGSSPSHTAGRPDTAWCLLQQGQQAVSLLLVVGPQQEQPFPWHPVSLLLQQLARYQEAHALQSRLRPVPLVLVVSAAVHLPVWSELLQRPVFTQRPLPQGGVLLLEQVRQSGLLAAPCWCFSNLAVLERSSRTASEEAVMLRPAVRVLLQEQLMLSDQSQVSQPQFGDEPRRLQVQRKQWTGTERKGQRRWKRSQSWCLPDPGWVTRLIAQMPDSDGLAPPGAGSLTATARLNLALTAQRKRMLLLLARFPLLSSAQLAQLLEPGQARRRLQRSLLVLSAANLVTSLRWPAAPSREQERWLLTEVAVAYLVTRGELPRGWVALPPAELTQMQHTHGLYACLATLLGASTHESMIVASWLWSTRESARRWFDPGRQEWVQLRPDATWIVWLRGHPAPVRLLIEYDRATTRRRELQAKWETYAAAGQQAGGWSPPVLIITTQPQAAARIRTCWQISGAPQPMLPLLQVELDQPDGLSQLTDWLLQLCSL
ncbi:replication-relaxation family protein [Thermogemmatispora sp.]|uniref:replication-relaxation family protein n=1 Tax=Thermogemmatispora sp. TaxID=1968838 RepID=UPI0035E402D9